MLGFVRLTVKPAGIAGTRSPTVDRVVDVEVADRLGPPHRPNAAFRDAGRLMGRTPPAFLLSPLATITRQTHRPLQARYRMSQGAAPSPHRQLDGPPTTGWQPELTGRDARLDVLEDYLAAERCSPGLEHGGQRAVAESGARQRIRHAGFPAIKTISDFDFTAQPGSTAPRSPD